MRASSSGLRGAQRRHPALPDHGNVARDLDLLRAAVGDAKLNYVGISYGTAIGETYTSLFPGRTGGS